MGCWYHRRQFLHCGRLCGCANSSLPLLVSQAPQCSMFETSPRRYLTIDSTVYSSTALLSCIRCGYSTSTVYKLLLCFVRTLQKRLPPCKSKEIYISNFPRYTKRRPFSSRGIRDRVRKLRESRRGESLVIKREVFYRR